MTWTEVHVKFLGRAEWLLRFSLERQEAKTIVAQTPTPERKPEIFSLYVLLMWYFLNQCSVAIDERVYSG